MASIKKKKRKCKQKPSWGIVSTKYHLIPISLATIKITKNNKFFVGENVEKSKPLCTIGGQGL